LRSDEKDRYLADTAAVDRLAEELVVIATDLPQEDRQQLGLCAATLEDRWQLGPHPSRIGHRAVWAMQDVVRVRLDGEPVPKGTKAVLKEFSESLVIVQENREESYRRAQEEWEEERERRRTEDGQS